MPIQVQGYSGVVVEVDGMTFRALRVTTRPINYGSLGVYRLGMTTGTMAAALAANAEVFQWRWADATNLGLVYKVTMSIGQQLASTAAIAIAMNLAIARGWSGIGTGGLRAVLTGNISKLRTSMGTSLVNDAGIATTAGLGAGTKTIDHATSNIGAVAFGVGTGAITTQTNMSLLPDTDLFNAMDGTAHPMVFVQNEGFIIRNSPVALPATMTWVASVNTVWAEAAAF
jgi:hypothetical protein